MASYRIRYNNLVERAILELLLDSSFIISLFSKPALRLEDVETSVGKVELVTLESVIDELRTIGNRAPPKRAKTARCALELTLRLKKVAFSKGITVDDKILNYAESYGAAVATVDLGLRRRLRAAGVKVVSLRSNRLFVEGPNL